MNNIEKKYGYAPYYNEKRKKNKKIERTLIALIIIIIVVSIIMIPILIVKNNNNLELKENFSIISNYDTNSKQNINQISGIITNKSNKTYQNVELIVEASESIKKEMTSIALMNDFIIPANEDIKINKTIKSNTVYKIITKVYLILEDKSKIILYEMSNEEKEKYIIKEDRKEIINDYININPRGIILHKKTQGSVINIYFENTSNTDIDRLIITLYPTFIGDDKGYMGKGTQIDIFGPIKAGEKREKTFETNKKDWDNFDLYLIKRVDIYWSDKTSATLDAKDMEIMSELVNEKSELKG